jgi:hypothetical protein
MSVIATDVPRLSNLLKKTDSDTFEFYTDVLTANEAGTPTYTLGTVLGKVTATGKYVKAVETAVDGSKVAAAVYIGNSFGDILPITLTAATDTKVLALTRGKLILSKDALVLDATYNDNTKKQAVYDSLKALGMLVEQTV